jgi:type IX secretion system PorP/SprF family membrane protein
MLKILRVLLPAFPLILPFSLTIGQDIVFTPFLNAPAYYNPALTGAKEGIHTYTLGRFQWLDLPFHYNSFHFEGDFGIRNVPAIGGFGLFISENQDGIGFIKDLRMGISFSSRIKVSPLFAVQIGIKASVIQKKINWDDLIWPDQLSELYGNIYVSSFTPPDADKKAFMDFGLGGLFQFRNTSGTFQGSSGIAVDHLFEPDQAFLSNGAVPLPRKYIVTSDFNILTNECSTCKLKGYGFSEPLFLTPGFLYQLQNSISTIQTGCNMTKFNFSFGFWYRARIEQDAYDIYSVLFGYRVFFSKSSFMNLSYTLNLSNEQIKKWLSETPIYAHEFCLSLHFTNL